MPGLALNMASELVSPYLGQEVREAQPTLEYFYANSAVDRLMEYP